ncbi:discoidin domain-containing protein [Jidongwangia harbinensis]|uniref:discoidin domain-containing protein n=1 Tax=Jidongwangia harbinensis TaxID=2878561 RepID=UPI001CD99C9B|nr:discoidin domain-containing protein [Jidongwangia harbinensis]MCA2217177.1 discoidin domain-containing protein [Jidongwangia harbinensis]
MGTGLTLPAVGAAEAAPSCPTAVLAADGAKAAEDLARTCRRPIENLAAANESTREFANPNGTFTREVSAEPRRVKRGNRWADIDPALRREDGGWSPAVSKVPVTFSGGGADPLVTLDAPGNRFTMAWPAPLPAPRVDGDTATYPGVYEGVDLVVRATGTGFTYVLVVHSAEAARNPALREVTFRFGGTARVTAIKDGFRVTDRGGRTLLTSAGASMWDSAGAREDGAGSTAEAAGDHARKADVGMRVTRKRLVLVPDRALLTTATYPLFIDPQTIPPGVSRWAYSNSHDSNNETGTIRAGRDPESGAIYRPFLEFPMNIRGTRVISANMRIVLWHSWSCGATPVTLWRTGPIASTPRNPWGATGYDHYLDTQSGAANKDDCYTPNTPTMYFGHLLASDLQYGPADRGWGSYTVGLSAMDSNGGGESTTNRWKKFVPGSAVLTVEFNNPPSPPGLNDMSIDPRQPCAAQPLYVNALNGVTLRGRLTDADGDNISAKWRVQGVPGAHQPPDSPRAPGGEFTTTIPAAAFTDGQTYSWSMSGTDGHHEGGTSPGCTFVISNSLPGGPVVTSGDLALTTGLLPPDPPDTAGVGRPVTITLKPAEGDRNIEGYLVGVGAGTATAPTLWVPAGPDGTAQAPVSPATSGPEPNILTVRSRNKAGMSGTMAVYRFAAQATERVAATDDLTGDGRSDLVYLRDTDGRATVWMSASKHDGSGSLDPVQVFDGGAAYPAAATRLVGGDYDGDGDSDFMLLRSAASGRVDASVLHSNGNALFALPAMWDSGASDWDLTTMQSAGADMTGDGKADLVIARPEADGGWSVRVFESTSTGRGSFTFAAPAAWATAGASTSTYARTAVRVADVDDDGKADVARVQDNGNGQLKVLVQTSTGSTLNPPRQWFDSGPDRFDFDRTTVLAGNVSGAGKADLILVQHHGNGDTSAVGLLSDGDRLTAERFWQSGGADTFDPARAKLVAGDFTGGRETDLAVLYDEGFAKSRYSLLRSTGSAFTPAARWSAALDWTKTALGGGGMTPNLALDAQASATSTAQTFAPGQAIDRNRTSHASNGWSSWSNLENDHAETISLLLPSWRYVNRIDLYPRNDGTNIGTSFPANLTVEVWTHSGWRTVATRNNPAGPGAGMVSLSFGGRFTDHVRVTGLNLRVMQLAEIELYQTGRGAPPANLVLDATATATSSAPEDWGWAPKWAVDGTRALPGWSSWSNHDVDHTEAIELTLRRRHHVNRVDLYPRPDGGGNFCRNFTIEADAGNGWVVASRHTNYPAPTSGAVQTFTFEPVLAQRLRVVCTSVRLTQFAEIEAYLVQ